MSDTSTSDLLTIPAIKVPLTGHHLIEASAGTGKTWTLTGILLRLLIEAKRNPERIIATTFTRAAATEMRERVHERLVDFYQLLQWVIRLREETDLQAQLFAKKTTHQNVVQNDVERSLNDNDNDNNQSSDHHQSSKSWQASRNVLLARLSERVGLKEHYADPVNQHLLHYLLDHDATYPIEEAMRRTQLVLISLDSLFIGTLDSLAQKWLNEYRSETGHPAGMDIVEDDDGLIDSIIHDAVREFHAQVYHRRPRLYQVMQERGKLTAVNMHKGAVNKALNFLSSDIDVVEVGEPFDFDMLDAVLASFANADLTDVLPLFDKDNRKKAGLNNRASLASKIECIGEIQQAVRQYGMFFESYLSEDAYKFYDAVQTLIEPWQDDKPKGFNKGWETSYPAFIALPPIHTLLEAQKQLIKLDTHLDSIQAYFNRQVILKVREKLPTLLQASNQTTFGLQMQRLNDALMGKQGESLARYIRHHYPIALIDESQDMNGSQASLIHRIYFSDTTKASDNNGNVFLLLVGDPKQAIYGFRGGDVANHVAIRQKFKSRMSLTVNRRSHQALVQALNHWFGQGDEKIDITQNSLSKKDDENQTLISGASIASSDPLSKLGEGIYYERIQAHNQLPTASWLMDKVEHSSFEHPVTILHLPYRPKDVVEQSAQKTMSLTDRQLENLDDCDLTARHIQHLLASGATFIEANKPASAKPIQPSDIAVLGRRKKELNQIAKRLHDMGIPTLMTADTSIFATRMASDLLALLEAMLTRQKTVVHRALTSAFYGVSLTTVNAISQKVEQDIAVNSSTSKATESLAISTPFASRDDKAVTNRVSVHLFSEADYQQFSYTLQLAGEQWEKWGILSALSLMLSAMKPTSRNLDVFDGSDARFDAIKPDIKNWFGISVWERLAGLAEGKRYLLDLRQLLDILAQYAGEMGEHELISWLKTQMFEQPTSDWAKQTPLPTESGVQLMTIHKSKGLQFPVVYVVGMEKAINTGSHQQLPLYLYEDDAKNVGVSQRRLSTTSDITKSNGVKDDAKILEEKESFAELKRLGYVAFTRPSEQLYIVLQDPYNTKDSHYKPMFEWLDFVNTKEYKGYRLPERLSGKIGWVDGVQFANQHELALKNNQLNLESICSSHDTSELVELRPLHEVIKQANFRGWAKTSFTALARQLPEEKATLAVMDERTDEGLESLSQVVTNASIKELPEQNLLHDLNSTDIRFTFNKGANAGTFLHHVLEHINFHQPTQWTNVIDRAVYQFQMPNQYTSSYAKGDDGQNEVSDNDNQSINNSNNDDELSPHQQLKQWLHDTLATPLTASNQPLSAIPKSHRLPEMSFNMGLHEFDIERLNKAFKTHLPNEPDKHIELTDSNSAHLFRYLRGEIDLVYQCEGRFYVVDYKSNFLGDSLIDYCHNNLSQAMNRAGYWLQAVIYQVALHRFLRLRVTDYVGNEDKYLGAVEYVFLRGIAPQVAHTIQSSPHPEPMAQNNQSVPKLTGLISWHIPIELVKALDEIFGYQK